MKYLQVKNWDRFQRYRRDRGGPPWIALHRKLQRDPEWMILTSEERGWLVDIWMLAAERNGEFPADPLILQKLCCMNSIPKFDALKHFLKQPPTEMDVQCQSSGRPVDVPETEDIYKNTSSKTHHFDAFWTAYPRKVGKKKAKAKWKTGKLDEKIDLILADLAQRKKNDPDWTKGSKYVLHPTTYLNGERWEDEPVPKSATVPKDDSACIRFAAKRNLNARPGESMRDFRTRVQAAVAKAGNSL